MDDSDDDLVGQSIYSASMDDSDDDLLGASIDSASMDEIQALMGELENSKTSQHTGDKASIQIYRDNRQPAYPANVTRDESELARESTSINPNQVKCNICSNCTRVGKAYGILICSACRVFIWKASRTKKQMTCITNRYDCEVTHATQHYCQG